GAGAPASAGSRDPEAPVSLGIEDLAVGHWSDPVGLTGCTVVVPPPGNVAAASVRGGGPGTRETALLPPQAHVEGGSAVLLTGGSAFGLAAAQGVVDWCERRGLGYGRFGRPIPIVPAAVLFHLMGGDVGGRPPGPGGGRAPLPGPRSRRRADGQRRRRHGLHRRQGGRARPDDQGRPR